MESGKFNRIFLIIICVFVGFFLLKVLFPLLLPFLLGGLLSAAAEPFVRFGCEKVGLKRPFSAFLGVFLTLGLTVCAAVLLGGLAVREMKSLARMLPDIQATARDGAQALEQNLLDLSHRLPENLQATAQQAITRVFTGEEGLLALPARKLPELAANVVGKVPGSALGVGTGLISSFLISVRLPRLKKALAARIPESWAPAWARLKHTLGKWLVAQGKLMGVTFAIVTAGFLLLRIPYALAWGAAAALVDAVPLLGTGILLIPWAVVKWSQGEVFTALGLGLVYACAALTRVVLEPRLVGKQLGLDPLAALVALYAGFRLWGFWGLVLAPVGASLVKNLIQKPGQT